MKRTLFSHLILIFCINVFALDTPTIVSPSDDASVWTGVGLDWAVVAGSEFYEFQIDLIPTFDSPALQSDVEAYMGTFGGNEDTEEFISDLRFGETYYWRVRAWVPGDISAWSLNRSADTRDNVTLNSPSDDAETWAGVDFH